MNLWKVFALIMILLLAFSVGLRFIGIGAFQISEEQKILAKNAAVNGLKEEMKDSSFNITVSDHGRIIHTHDGEKKAVRVIITQENVTLTALVDIETGDVVEKSKLEYGGWMINYRNQNSGRWGHQRLFDR